MRFLRRLGPYFLLVFIIATGVTFWFRHDELFDWIAQRNYQPSDQVQQLAAETGMTPKSQRLFYVNRPVVEGKDSFNKHCVNPPDQVSTLGCFTGNRLGIYIYDVTDPRLYGVEQVTAAHEMLHQAYLRLNKTDKNRIDMLLQDFYDSQLSDQTVKDQLQTYTTSEPGQLVNEMHSILGTEIANLPPELETYYRQYFVDRGKVVQYYAKYQGEFTQRNQQIKDYDAQLDVLKAQIEANKKDLDSREKTLQEQHALLDTYRSNDQIAEYNSAVPGYNALVTTYRGEVNETNRLIAQYNDLLSTRNSIAVQERQLQQALNSRVDNASEQ